MKRKTPFVRVPMPTFTESALNKRCPMCGYLPPTGRWHTVKACHDNLQIVPFLLVSCLRCGAPVERYAALKKAGEK